MTSAKATIECANQEQQRYGSYEQAQNIAYKVYVLCNNFQELHDTSKMSDINFSAIYY